MVRLQLTTNSLILRTKDVGRERNVLAGSLEDKYECSGIVLVMNDVIFPFPL
jgi:hypothetical protein